MTQNLKKIAGEAAVEAVKDGMVLGLGTGSTVYYSIKKIGELIAEGWELIGIPTSASTVMVANECNIPLTTLEEHPTVDLTIDGADEVDPNLDLIKGMGGALLREKIVASCSKWEIIVVDDSKLVEVLGTKSPLPVEVTKYGVGATTAKLKRLGCTATQRLSESGPMKPFVSDNGNYIIDCKFTKIPDPKTMERKLNTIPGVVENGLFLGLTSEVIVASPGGIKRLKRTSGA